MNSEITCETWIPVISANSPCSPTAAPAFALRHVAAACLLFAVLAWCAPAAGEQDVFSQAQKSYQEKNYAAAYRSAGKLIVEFPQSELGDDAFMLQAESSARLAKWKRTCRVVNAFIKKYPESELLSRAYYTGAVALVRKGDAYTGVQYLFKTLGLPHSQWMDSAATRGINMYVGLKATPQDLQDLEDLFVQNRGIAAHLRYLRAVKLMEMKNYVEACTVFESYLKQFADDGRAERARRFYSDVKEKCKNDFCVLGLLPLSGEYRQVGMSVMNGADMAFNEYNARGKTKIYWKPEDTRGNAVTTMQIVQDFMKENRPFAVLGPVLSQEVIAASLALGATWVPLVTPTANTDGLTAISPALLQVPVTVETSTRKLAEYAFATLKIRDFVIISPLTDYGKTITEAFRRAVLGFGAPAPQVEYYLEGETDFKSIYRRIRQRKYEEEYYLRMLDSGKVAWDDSVTVKDSIPVFVGGIFLPCNAEEVIALASQARHYQVNGQFLGTQAWYSAEMAGRDHEAVEGSIICVDFAADSLSQPWMQFAGQYKKLFAVEPDRIAGKAYDAAGLICRALDAGKTESDDMMYYLRDMRDIEGVAGKISFNPLTRSNEETCILRIKKGTFVRVQ